jgi:putative Holliday junction resolvase
MEGTIGGQARKVEAFIRLLSSHTDVPVEFRDERLTTVSAKRLMQEVGSRKAGKKTRYDAIAAAIILQSYLDERH